MVGGGALIDDLLLGASENVYGVIRDELHSRRLSDPTLRFGSSVASKKKKRSSRKKRSMISHIRKHSMSPRVSMSRKKKISRRY